MRGCSENGAQARSIGVGIGVVSRYRNRNRQLRGLPRIGIGAQLSINDCDCDPDPDSDSRRFSCAIGCAPSMRGCSENSSAAPSGPAKLPRGSHHRSSMSGMFGRLTRTAIFVRHGARRLRVGCCLLCCRRIANQGHAVLCVREQKSVITQPVVWAKIGLLSNGVSP
jgi:hypothetical protein